MTCPNCLKIFNPRVVSPEEWLFLQNMDTSQTEYVLANYATPLCGECTTAIRRNFYRITLNPLRHSGRYAK